MDGAIADRYSRVSRWTGDGLAEPLRGLVHCAGRALGRRSVAPLNGRLNRVSNACVVATCSDTAEPVFVLLDLSVHDIEVS